MSSAWEAPGRRPLPRGLAWAVVAVIVVAYNTWVLWPWVDGGQIMSGGLISELAADSRPRNVLFRAGDVITGVIIVATAVLGARRWQLTSRPGLLAVAMGVTGVGIAADAIFNLNCSATMDSGCVATGDLAAQPLAHQIHAATSTLYATALIAALLLVSLTGRGRWRFHARWLLAVQVLGNVVLAVADLLEQPQQTWIQAVSVVLIAAWASALVLALAHPVGPRRV